MNLVQCIISRHFICDRKFRVVLYPLAPDPDDVTAPSPSEILDPLLRYCAMVLSLPVCIAWKTAAVERDADVQGRNHVFKVGGSNFLV